MHVMGASGNWEQIILLRKTIFNRKKSVYCEKYLQIKYSIKLSSDGLHFLFSWENIALQTFEESIKISKFITLIIKKIISCHYKQNLSNSRIYIS